MLDTYNLIGAVGAAIVIVAYLATQRGQLSAEDWRFPLANLVGAVLIVISLFAQWNLPSFIVEVFWIAISIYGLWRSLRRG
jgi:hypothetical protein